MNHIKPRKLFLEKMKEDALSTLADKSDGQDPKLQDTLNKLDDAAPKTGVVTRFAPSPTGKLHIGGLRTALYNYLFARKNGGKFILRIEDTDQKRFDDTAEKYIQDTLSWAGMEVDESPWDEGGENGPYRQSERDYSGHIQELIDSGDAYYAFDTAEDLAAARAADKWFAYSHKTRMNMKNSLAMSADEVKAALDAGTPYVLRFKMPENKDISFDDIIRDTVKQNTNQLDDKVIVKSNGIPTYHLANVCDDHNMGVTHVIRGEEWISSTPLHVLLYGAFGWDLPTFAHLPLLLNPNGKGKLSKRMALKLGFPVLPMGGEGKDDKGNDVHYQGFKDEGYYADALMNFLFLLGWAPKDNREFFTLAEMIEEFDLNTVHKAGAKFDIDKAKWFNAHYLQGRDDADIKRHLDLGDTFKYDDERMKMILDVAKKRSTFPKEMNAVTDIFFKPVVLSEVEKEKATDDFKKVFTQFIEADIDWNDSNDIKQKIWEICKASEVRMGKVMPALRQAICDGISGPDLPTTMYILGKDESINRINNIMS